MNDRKFAKLYLDIFQEEKHEKLSLSARWLYATLCMLNNSVGNNSGSFYRSDAQLADDAGMGVASVKRAKKELADLGIIEMISTKNNDKKATIYRL